MKKAKRICALLFACAAAVSLLASCKDQGESNDSEILRETYSGMPEYDISSIDSYIKPFKYTGLTVYRKNTETASEALWNAVSCSAEMIAYPNEQVEYYAVQERAKYRYYANRDGIEYEILLESLGVTEESIYEIARGYVKDDLVLEYIVKDAQIALTDAEKEAHKDKYAQRLTQVYGYDKEYIKANMTEQIYDAMLYDKAMEYLLLNNTVHTAQGE